MFYSYALAFWIAALEKQLDVCEEVLKEYQKLQMPKSHLKIIAVRGHRINEHGYQAD